MLAPPQARHSRARRGGDPRGAVDWDSNASFARGVERNLHWRNDFFFDLSAAQEGSSNHGLPGSALPPIVTTTPDLAHRQLGADSSRSRKLPRNQRFTIKRIFPPQEGWVGYNRGCLLASATGCALKRPAAMPFVICTFGHAMHGSCWRATRPDRGMATRSIQRQEHKSTEASGSQLDVTSDARRRAS